MAKLQLYRETEFNEYLSTLDVDDGTNFRVVWSWVNSANVAYWNISKSVSSAAHQINLALSEQEVVQLPFLEGYVTVYKINDTTGRKTYYTNLLADVDKGTAGSAYNPTIASSIPAYMLFSYAGQAAIDTMVGSYTVTEDSTITGCNISAQNAPIGQSLIVEIYINGVASGVTAFLAAGDRTNPTTISLAVIGTDVVTAKITQTGTTNEGAEIQVILSMVTN